MLPQEDLADAELAVDPDPQLEREAERAAQEAMSDGPVTVNRMGTDVAIQRSGAGIFTTWMEEEETPFDDVDGWQFLKDAGRGLLGELPGGTFVSEMLGSLDEQSSQVDDLRENLKKVDPPEEFVERTAQQAVEMIGNEQTGGSLEGVGESGNV